MTVVSKSATWGANRAPRIIRPSRYIMVTENPIRAPRPGRFSRKCPAPGISQPSRMAANQLEDAGSEAGVAEGAGVTGNAAPGLSLTESFYRITKPYPHAHLPTARSRHPQSAAGVSIQELQLLVVDFDSVFGSRSQTQHEQSLILQAKLRGVPRGRSGDGRGSYFERLDGS